MSKVFCKLSNFVIQHFSITNDHTRLSIECNLVRITQIGFDNVGFYIATLIVLKFTIGQRARYRSHEFTAASMLFDFIPPLASARRSILAHRTCNDSYRGAIYCIQCISASEDRCCQTLIDTHPANTNQFTNCRIPSQN